MIHCLQRRVEEQEEEIMQLRRRITQLQTSQLTVNFSELENTWAFEEKKKKVASLVQISVFVCLNI